MTIYLIYMMCFSIAIFLWGYVIKRSNSTYGIFFYDDTKYKKDIFCKVVSKYFFLVGITYFIYSILILFYRDLIVKDNMLMLIYEVLISVTFLVYITLCLLEISRRAKMD